MILLAPDDGSDGGSGTGAAVAEPPSSTQPATAVTPPVEGQAPPTAPSLIPPAAPVPAPTTGVLGDEWINEDGTFRQGWYQRFPEEIQVPLAQIKTVEDLAKGYGNAQKMIGRKGVFVPGDKSRPEEVTEFRKAMGIPETPEAYQIKPDNLPPGMSWNDDLAKPFLAVAHKHHVSNAALKELSAAFTQMEVLKSQHLVETVQVQHAQKIKEGTEKLQQLWQGDFDRNKLKAQRAATLAGIPVDDPGFLSPTMVAGVVRLADLLSEDKLIGATGGLEPTMSPKAMALDIVNNPNNPRHKMYHEGDKDTQALVREYFKAGSKKAA